MYLLYKKQTGDEVQNNLEIKECGGGGGVRVLLPPTATVVRGRDLGLKSHPKDN